MASHRIVLASFGSFGDLHPYLGIARELQRRGHTPVIATVPYYEPKVLRAGLPFVPLRSAEMRQPDVALMEKIFDLRRGAEFIVRDLVMPSIRVAYADAMEALEGASLLVSHPLTFAARLAAEKRGLPWLSTQLAPFGLLSAFDPPVLPPAEFLARLRPLGPRFWGPLLALGKRSTRNWSEPYRRLRAEIGLGAAPNVLFEGAASPFGTLALFSSALGARQPDWPQGTVQTGFVFYDGEEPALPSGLREFLEAGEPPIVFTLGSSAVLNPGRFYMESAEAAARLGRRALLLGCDPGSLPAGLPDGAAAFDYAPYSLVLPRAAAIVHQGGVGTTAQAMRAGRPMLVMPYAVDQPDNGARMRRLGVARVVPRRRYRAALAAGELRLLLRDSRYTDRAKSVAAQLRREDGAGTACDAIEALLRGRET